MVSYNESVFLSEQDYLGILDVIARFHDCSNEQDLREAFQSSLFPLLEGTSGIYAWTDRDIGKLQIMGAINISESDLDAFEECVKADRLSRMLVSQGRPVLAYDIDRPREDIVQRANVFLESPKNVRRESPYITRIRTALLAVEVPEPTLGIGICRIPPDDKPWTYREVRILELLRPHLLNSIKTILLTEELGKYQSLAAALTNIPTPIALVTGKCRLIFHNAAFSDTFGTSVGQILPSSLARVLQSEMAEYNPPLNATQSKTKMPFCQLPEGIFRPSLSGLERDVGKEARLWLLRLNPAVELYSVNKLVQNSKLTNREMEVCSLVRNGIADREIAERLFISLDTVKNHIKHLHQKLGVHTRGELVALLSSELSRANYAYGAK